ncbi:phage tail spike protein [Bacillus smithii]|uniref:phage tail spike protein n=1 Tax=Bacillus smithii TaxID=1479 RepID=UPI0030C9BE6E
MLVVTSLSGQTEALPDVKNIEITEQVNGEFSLSFTCFFTERNQHAYPLVQEEAIVELDGHEYRIKQMTEIRNQKEVHAQHVYFDLVDHPQEGTFGGTHTVDEFFSYALNGTGWTFENVDVTESAFIPNFGEGNVVALINQICAAFNCEIKIEPNKHIKIYKQIGEDTDNQFRYRHNIKTLKRSVDTTKLATAIKGYGANGLVVEYHSPNEAIYGTRYAEPMTDENYTEADSLREKLKQELVDVPEVSIDIELSQLGFDVGLGDRIWLIYEPMGIEFQTRIMQMKSYPFTHKSPVVTLSNVKQTVTDILTQQKIEIDQNKKETRSKIEQTNEKITLEVERIDESIASIQVEADNIQLSVQSLNNRLQSAESQISIQAEQIEQRVKQETYDQQVFELDNALNDLQMQVYDFSSDNKLTTPEAKALETALVQVKNESTDLLNVADSLGISAEKTDYEDAISSLESELSNWINAESYPLDITASQRDEINDKFSDVQDKKAILINKIAAVREENANDYTDSQLDPIESRLATAESSITQTANQINLKVSLSTYNNDMANVNNRLANAESQISIQASQISSKVSQTDFNGNKIASLINQTATSVQISANHIDLEGIVQVNSQIDIGYIWDSSEKAVNFRGDASLYTPAGSSSIVLESAGYIYLDAYNVYLGSYYGSAVPVVKSYQSYQPISLEVTGSGGLVVRVNGKTATFAPTSWTG